MTGEKIFVIEDNDTMRLGIVETLRRDGHKVFEFENGPAAIKESLLRSPTIAVIDLKMEPMNGIDVLAKLKETNPKIEALMISAYGTVDDAVKAMKLGAYDFMSKPFSPEELRMRINKLCRKISDDRQLENIIEQNRYLKEEYFSGSEEIVGNSDIMKNIFILVNQVAGKGSAVLIQGESGTGKELIAKAIHKKSVRSENAFIKINCGALNDNLLESELFGHEKGSFTGAIRQKKGRFELADKGTLLLDEIGDISPSMQVKLLRVLQEGEFERVGGEETINTDVRIISSTNRNLEKLISEGKFREDLFYRLSVIPIHLPSLRERREDIPALVTHFLKKMADKNRQELKDMEPDGLKLLIEYPWPGNIRELENLIERLVVISDSKIIDALLVARHISSSLKITNGFDNLLAGNSGISLEEAVNAFEKNLIIQAMKKSDGVKNRAAKLLGISTSVLYYKLEKFELL